MDQKRKKQEKPKPVMDLIEAQAQASCWSGKNRVILMELKPEIRDALVRGYKWKVIWQALQQSGRIDMSYNTFRAQCRAIGLDTARGAYASAKKHFGEPSSVSGL